MPSPQSQKEVGRRAVVALVKDCIAQVNGLTVGFTDVRTANNALAEQTGLDVQHLTGRLDGVGQWCKRNEEANARESRRLTQTRVELGQATLEQEAFTLMTLWQRLRWLFTGAWPKPARDPFVQQQAGHDADAAYGKATTITAGRSHLSGASGYIPHTSLGPRVLP